MFSDKQLRENKRMTSVYLAERLIEECHSHGISMTGVTERILNQVLLHRGNYIEIIEFEVLKTTLQRLDDEIARHKTSLVELAKRREMLVKKIAEKQNELDESERAAKITELFTKINRTIIDTNYNIEEATKLLTSEITELREKYNYPIDSAWLIRQAKRLEV